ncbi:hypothetical protein NEOC65_000442 [Neochlamydia sp. AcF65]|nr:hypothetical protein [Neochlamydia sp. AcF65]
MDLIRLYGGELYSTGISWVDEVYKKPVERIK